MINAAEESAILTQLRDERQREQGFGALVRVYGPLLHRHLLRMLQSSADVDDVLQNTLIKVYRHLDRFREESKLSTWLYRIATNEALAWLRSQQRRERRISSEDPALTAGRTLRADPFFDGDAAQLELQKALAALPDKQRAVFLLRYYDELPYAEISQITGTSEGALKASYHLAVKKIESKLKAYAQ
ncbi:RNA polymerase sigma factor [Neolewinella lacunae]|nr:RNA polymerase sigma factor [Neolewinella lacunae]MDN3634612.1 RNA polymerase sigma factor [Neolewinella lacunae]